MASRVLWVFLASVALAARIDVTNAGLTVTEGNFCVQDCNDAVLTQELYLEKFNETQARLDTVLLALQRMLKLNDVCGVSHCVLESAIYIPCLCTPPVADVCYTSGTGRAADPCPTGYTCNALGDCEYTAAPARVIFVSDTTVQGDMGTSGVCLTDGAALTPRMNVPPNPGTDPPPWNGIPDYFPISGRPAISGLTSGGCDRYTGEVAGPPFPAPNDVMVYLNSRGEILATDQNALWAGLLAAPLYHADGSVIDTAGAGTSECWTGCTPIGDVQGGCAGDFDCDTGGFTFWTNSGAGSQGSVGTVDVVGTANWLEVPGPSCPNCNLLRWAVCINMAESTSMILPRDTAPPLVP